MGMSARTISILRYGAFGAIGGAMALSPLGFAGADPESTPATPATVTATVTAIVAPDQCKPLPDGKLPQKAVDYATDGGPIETPAEGAPDEKLDKTEGSGQKATAEEGGEIQGKGPFDPYLCQAQGTTAASPTTTPVNAEPPGPKLEDIPGVTPTLRPYPGQGPGGMAESPEGGSGVELGPPNPSATPTENPAPRPGTGLSPSSPLG